MALAALVLALVPGTWWRTAVRDRLDTTVTITALAHGQASRGGFTVHGLWQLSALNENFGGYSAIGLPEGRVRLFSDKGWLLTIARPDGPPGPTRLRQLYPTGIPPEDLRDIESVTYHPRTGQYWVGHENRHTIYRYSNTGEPEAFVQPGYARGWRANSGIEAMVRLADGRFIVLKETLGLGYLYGSDPVDGAQPQVFRLALPDGFLPTDMAELPDGRVLVLLRRLGWHMPVFESLIAIAEPDAITPDKPWPVTPLARVEDLVPRDNWEGIAIERGAAGQTVVWLVSDDNKSAFQRSLLAKLEWAPPAE